LAARRIWILKAAQELQEMCRLAEFFGSHNQLSESLMSKLCLPFLGLVMFLFASPGNVTADDKHNSAYEACACDHCATHCATLTAEGKKEHLTTLKECQDCATCCSACAQVCARGGPQTALMTECCAKCCDQCAKACEKFPDDKHMKACAEECRKCQKACEVMAKHVGK
jgi:hypothetical protein